MVCGKARKIKFYNSLRTTQARPSLELLMPTTSHYSCLIAFPVGIKIPWPPVARLTLTALIVVGRVHGFFHSRSSMITFCLLQNISSSVSRLTSYVVTSTKRELREGSFIWLQIMAESAFVFLTVLVILCAAPWAVCVCFVLPCMSSVCVCACIPTCRHCVLCIWVSILPPAGSYFSPDWEKCLMCFYCHATPTP